MTEPAASTEPATDDAEATAAWWTKNTGSVPPSIKAALDSADDSVEGSEPSVVIVDELGDDGASDADADVDE